MKEIHPVNTDKGYALDLWFVTKIIFLAKTTCNFYYICIKINITNYLMGHAAYKPVSRKTPYPKLIEKMHMQV